MGRKTKFEKAFSLDDKHIVEILSGMPGTNREFRHESCR
jgi:hypothetical protein